MQNLRIEQSERQKGKICGEGYNAALIEEIFQEVKLEQLKHWLVKPFYVSKKEHLKTKCVNVSQF